MKTLSIQQPWASLICHGIKDVENRTWKPATLPGKILIHASTKKVTKNFFYQIPVEWVSVIENEILMNNIPELKDLPTSAIIGYVEVKGFADKTESLWDGGEECIKWLLGDAYLFDEPILGVNGKLNLFDYPEIDENNLPPAHKIILNRPTLQGDELVVPLSEQAFFEAEESHYLSIDITDGNSDLLCPEPDGIVSATTIQLVCGDKVSRYIIKEKAIADYVDEETNEPIIEEWNGEEYKWYHIEFAFGDKITKSEVNTKTSEKMNENNMMSMKSFDNITQTVKADLQSVIQKESKLSIAASCFSIYAFEELKKELEKIDELRFIFTAPTFTTEKERKERREFYIPQLGRERNLYGSEFELKLRNELSQKAIAKECAEWIRKKVTFKSNITQSSMNGFIHVKRDNDYVYSPISGFTTTDIGCDRGNNLCNMVSRLPVPVSDLFLKSFDELWGDKSKMQDVTESVIRSISDVYKENSPEFIYYVTLYNIFNEFLEDISEDVLPNEATGFKESKVWNMLYNFQKDAVLAIINKLEKYNGCILADSVGLGKTFTALAVAKYYENRNRSVLVLCPKKLSNNWNTYKDNYVNNPIAADRLRYDVLFHTDLSRTNGKSNGLDLDRLNWGNYDLVIIDESHNFRNGGNLSGDENEKENRYTKLLNKVIRKGVKTKVLMLSATPVNNRFNDLKNQLQLAYEGDSSFIDHKLNTTNSIDDIFRNAQQAFNLWSRYAPADRTSNRLLKLLDFDFFEVLDSVTIARSRKHIEKYYDTTDIGKFPTRLTPHSHRPPLTDLADAISYNEIFEQLTLLNLSIYTPSHFILPSKKDRYAELYEDNSVNVNFTQANREEGIRRLTAINLMKRMESSVYSFNLTLSRMKNLIERTIETINEYQRCSKVEIDLSELSTVEEYDEDDLNNDDLFSIGKKVKIALADMDYKSWLQELNKDREVLELITVMVADITPEHDSKLQMLLSVIKNKIENPINWDNKKVIIFTAFADTAQYLYDNVSPYIKSNFGLDSAMVTGSVEGRTTVPKLRSDLNTVLTCFSPISKDKQVLMPNNTIEIDLLIATDCISEGQNLQDCDYLINYDIHWNPVRIIQRFGRIDRIGSRNECIQLVNFWPNITLDEYINLKSKVETRMKIVDMTATGDDNLLSENEKMDLEYRKQQLKRLQDEVVDIEDMQTGISIMDLGLNEFRLDLLEYVNKNPDLDKTPCGLHAVAPCQESTPPGVIYVLKNRSNNVNIDNQNRLHPFYIVYISTEGEVIINHLEPKEILDKMRYLCKGKKEPMPDLYKAFNKETHDGRNMRQFSELLGEAIASIIEVKSESEIDSFLNGGEVSFLSNEIKGLDDFELLCFLVVK